jgi:S1-C subfamily serine protease
MLKALRFSLVLTLLVEAKVLGQQQDTAAKIYAQASKSVLVILLKSSNGDVVAQGTGFLIDGGKIVTNEHVIRGEQPQLISAVLESRQQ